MYVRLSGMAQPLNKVQHANLCVPAAVSPSENIKRLRNGPPQLAKARDSAAPTT